MRTTRLWLFVVLALVVVSPTAKASSLQEGWLEVQKSLAAAELEELDISIDELEETAAGLGAERLTPFAAALVGWSVENPGPDGKRALEKAHELDPGLPAIGFEVARRKWKQHAFVGAIGAYVKSWWSVLVYAPSRSALLASVVLWFIVAVGVSCGLLMITQVLLNLRLMVHDAKELGRVLFQRTNAVVFAVVLMLLPIFAGLGPVWLLAYLFVLSWAYVKGTQRAVGVASMIVLALLTPVLELWQSGVVRRSSVTSRVAYMLERRQVDFSTLREFAELEGEMAGNSSYHLIYGELMRMHGDPGRARVQFQKAALNDPNDPTPLVALGCLALEDGDVSRAIHQLSSARDLDARYALAYQNLSFAHDQSLRYKLGDEARTQARQLAGRRAADLGVRGLDSRIRFPRLGKRDVDRMVDRLAPETRLALGVARPVPQLGGSLLSSLSITMVVSCALGLALGVARKRWMWTSSACAKCGRVFCPKCKSSTESPSYCSQCISVFLKRDVVAIEQQAAKMVQIRRWDARSSAARRLLGMLIPGSHHVVEGRLIAAATVLVTWLFFVVGALMWVPMLLPSVEPHASGLPLRVLLIVTAGLVWLRSAVGAWYRR